MNVDIMDSNYNSTVISSTSTIKYYFVVSNNSGKNLNIIINIFLVN